MIDKQDIQPLLSQIFKNKYFSHEMTRKNTKMKHKILRYAQNDNYI